MSREYPDWISPERAAEGKRIFSGTVPFSRMQRLAPLMAFADGEASFTAVFGHDAEGRVVIDLKVSAALPLVCQASLETYDEQITRRAGLAVVADEHDLDSLPDHYEAVRTEKGRLAIVSLVEDELLLALPTFPRKPGTGNIAYSTDGQAPGIDSDAQEDTRQPFAALQQMLESKKQD